ncbi:MAG: heat shock protein Hsp20 [Pedosphaera sp.]|nr:heat shock protein Hsp20 [Pedosphaera sp.]
MADNRSIRLRQLQGRVGDVVYQLTRVQFSEFSPAANWRPPVNAYRCPERMTICVDLAGVDRSAVDLEVEPRRLLLRGFRELPEPAGNEEQPMQILALEIDHGRFEREIHFPSDVEPARVTAEQRNGLLWVYLPWRSSA